MCALISAGCIVIEWVGRGALALQAFGLVVRHQPNGSGEEEIVTALVKREMGSAYPLKAPLDVNAGLGLTWHEAAH